MRSTRKWFIVIIVAVVGLLLLAKTQSPTDRTDQAAEPTPGSIDATPIATPDSKPTQIPEADLISAFTTVCAEDNVNNPDDQWPQADLTARRYAYDEIQAKTSDRLSSSSNPEHLHVAALLEEYPPARIALLDRAISQDSSDAFLLWSAVRICSELDDRADCRLEEWQQRLIEIDGQNSESWVRVATNRYAAGDKAGALEAMQHASTAAESRIYWTEAVETLERGYAAATDLEFSQRALMAFGVAASQLPSFAPALNMCREESADNEVWAYTCLAYGELAENLGKTEIGVSIGQSFQILASEGLGDEQKAATVRLRQDARRDEMINDISNREYNAMIERVFFSDPTLFSAYLMAVRSDGEIEAQRNINSQIERLLEQRPELACESLLPDAQSP